MQDVAPILFRKCIACTNPKKSESNIIMTLRATGEGRPAGEGSRLEPGDPTPHPPPPPGCKPFVEEFMRPDGAPGCRVFFFKKNRLPPEQIALIERRVKEGANTTALRSARSGWSCSGSGQGNVPESTRHHPVTVDGVQPRREEVDVVRVHEELNLWKSPDGTLARRLPGPRRTADLGHRV